MSCDNKRQTTVAVTEIGNEKKAAILDAETIGNRTHMQSMILKIMMRYSKRKVIYNITSNAPKSNNISAQ